MYDQPILAIPSEGEGYIFLARKEKYDSYRFHLQRLGSPVGGAAEG